MSPCVSVTPCIHYIVHNMTYIQSEFEHLELDQTTTRLNHFNHNHIKSLEAMAALKFADYLQRSISLFLFGTTLFAGFITAQNIRRRRQARALRLAADEQTTLEVLYMCSYLRPYPSFNLNHVNLTPRLTNLKTIWVIAGST